MNDSGSNGSPAFATPKDIRERHIALMQESLDPKATPNFVSKVLEFINQVAEAGVVLEASDERTAAQNILDYWNASLIAISKPKPTQAARTELEPFKEGSRGQSAPSSVNPFLDIRALGLDDRALLAGREDAIRSMVEHLRQHPIVFVTGPPGSGRTSLVLAGVVPQLANSASDPRCVLTFSSPGPDPLAALAGVVPNVRAADLRRSPELFRAKVDEGCRERGALLVVENAEELITRCSDEQMRDIFAKAIASLASDPRRHSVILIVGDDWVDSVFRLAALKPYATPAARFSLTPPTAAEIQRVLFVLASNAGVRIEPGVVEDLAHDLHGDMAALSLARFMLLHLWPLGKGGFIDWDAYRELGRPNDALDQIAERTYQSLSDEEKSAAKELFLRLTSPGISRSGSSLRVSRKDIIANGKNSVLMSRAVKVFEREGLLRRSASVNCALNDNTDDSLEIIHDNLMFRWKRLDEWLKDRNRNSERRVQVMATADLWNKSGRLPGYLFNDDASIKEARKYIDYTPTTDLLRDFVDASDDALTKIRKREKNRLYITIAAIAAFATLLVVLLAMIYHYHSREQFLIEASVAELRKLTAGNDTLAQDKQDKLVAILKNIIFLQQFGGADLDLSTIPIKDLNLRDFNFDNLHLVDSKVKNVDLSSSFVLPRNLINSAFSGSEISNSKFNQSNLSFSQFRNAKLRGVDFTDANLKRASFDNARLCDVKFAGATLLHATFSNATLDRNTILGLQNSAWWLADGWIPPVLRQLQLLAREQRPNVSNSNVFKTDRKKVESDVAEAQTATDDFNLAIKLNDLAWFLTINGADLLSNPPGQVQKTAKSRDDGQCDPRNEIPQSALAAATYAICLIDHVTVNDKYASYKLTLEDTLGYIYLQSAQVKDGPANLQDALAHLRTATGNGSKDAAKDALFRLAVAENAAGRSDEALAHMKMSIGKGYVPTHERALLANYLGLNDFGAQLDQALTGKDASPSVESEMMCTQ
jgi:uncharacterized protein YjbI with pentapeptide repeats